MGADNWKMCPKCIRDSKIEKENKYGKVPEAEYLALLEKLKPGSGEWPETLREDYEISTDEDGEFFVSYSCRCTKCDFFFNFEHKEQLEF